MEIYIYRKYDPIMRVFIGEKKENNSKDENNIINEIVDSDNYEEKNKMIQNLKILL